MRTRRVVLVGSLAVAIALIIAVISWRPEPEVPPGPATGLGVVLVAVDGMDWYLTRRYVDEGRLPTLARFLRPGVIADVAADRPVLPDVGWTRVGRGRSLTDTERATVEGNGDRRLFGITPDIVTFVEDSGGRTLCVGWPASWPATSSGPAVVAPYAQDPSVHALGLPPTLFVRGPRQASSAALEELVREIVARNEALYEDEFEERVFRGRGPGDAVGREHLAAARWAFLSDTIVLDLAAQLIAQEEPDLSLVYFGGLDAVSHRFLAPAMPDYFSNLPDAAHAYAEVLPRYYHFIDDALDRLMRLTDERTIFIVCSAYGMHPSTETPPASGAHDMGPPGVLIARGPALRKPPAPLTVSTTDIVPTLLAALGLPIPNDTEGRVLVELVAPRLLERVPLTYTDPPLPTEPTPPDSAALAAMARLADAREAMIRESLRD